MKDEFDQETLLQKEEASEVAAFSLLLDTTHNVLKRMPILFGEMDTRMKGNGLSKYICKGRIFQDYSCLVWYDFFFFFLIYFWWKGEWVIALLCAISVRRNHVWDMQVKKEEGTLSI